MTGWELLWASGWTALKSYVLEHTITCLAPAFFIAGAIAVFVSQASILRYFGPQAKKVVSYGVASVSGTVLAVCSCTVLPLFAGIYKRGAGLGPAMAFVFSGPAINILAIVYTARLLGWEIGLARAVGAVSFAAVVGLLMAWIFRAEEKEKAAKAVKTAVEEGHAPAKLLTIFAAMLGVLLFATAGIPTWAKLLAASVFIIQIGIMLNTWFEPEEASDWMRETWKLVVLITPVLLIGVFIAGAIEAFVPREIVSGFVGGNTLQGNFLASIFGAFMYFATLTEVPIIKSFQNLGMGPGPSLALLLAGPALSLPNMIVLARILGWKKTLVFCGIVVVLATFTGFAYGFIAP